MHTARSAVQQTYNRVQSLDESFRDYFALEDHILKNYRGLWQDQLFVRITLELRSRCVCNDVRDDRFRQLRETVMAFQELPEIKPQVQVEQPNPKP